MEVPGQVLRDGHSQCRFANYRADTRLLMTGSLVRGTAKEKKENETRDGGRHPSLPAPARLPSRIEALDRTRQASEIKPPLPRPPRYRSSNLPCPIFPQHRPPPLQTCSECLLSQSHSEVSLVSPSVPLSLSLRHLHSFLGPFFGPPSPHRPQANTCQLPTYPYPAYHSHIHTILTLPARLCEVIQARTADILESL